ncbi:MAG: muconate cycloisomerase [Rhodobacteraceae bacterium]|nr:muconate cycloisomerase [Paracoccaceae bacterium]MAY46096.1 muconate cycloisomerase [Paracoccaceae bacterium]
MIIKSIEAFPIRLPARRDFKWAGLRENLGGFVVVRLETEGGVTGWGEATPLPDWGGAAGRRAGETQATVCAMIRDVLAPVVVGMNVCDVNAARLNMDAAAIGNSYAKLAIDMALHDAWGKIVGQPVYRLLGGRVREGVRYAHMVGLMDHAEAMEEGMGAFADGCTALQIKGGVDPERDIRLVAELRKEAGDAVFMRLDANQGYRTARDGIDYLARLKDAGADGCEQPGANLQAMVGITQRGNLPVMADESCWDAVDAMEVVQTGAADWISIYLAKAGGYVGARKVAAIAETMNVPCDVNGSIESGIGNAANLHFVVSQPAVTLPNVIPVNAPAGSHPCKIAGNYYTDDILAQPMTVVGDSIMVSDAPGLGIEIDEDKLRKYRQDLA